MSETIELPDALVQDATFAADIRGGSSANQLELWVRLGQELERLLPADRALALEQRGLARTLRDRVADHE